MGLEVATVKSQGRWVDGGWNAFSHRVQNIPSGSEVVRAGRSGGRRGGTRADGDVLCWLPVCRAGEEELQAQSKKGLKKQQKEAEKAAKKAEKQAKLVSEIDTPPHPLNSNPTTCRSCECDAGTDGSASGGGAPLSQFLCLLL